LAGARSILRPFPIPEKVRSTFSGQRNGAGEGAVSRGWGRWVVPSIGAGATHL